MQSLSARLAKLEAAQSVPMMPPLRLVMSDSPPDPELAKFARTPGSPPIPLTLVFGKVEIDPGDLGW